MKADKMNLIKGIAINSSVATSGLSQITPQTLRGIQNFNKNALNEIY
jgi:hypothetical protein